MEKYAWRNLERVPGDFDIVQVSAPANTPRREDDRKLRYQACSNTACYRRAADRRSPSTCECSVRRFDPAGVGRLYLASGDEPRLDYQVWTAAAHVPLVRFADRARAISSTGLDLLELNRAPAPLRADLASFDSIESWYGSAREEFRTAVAGLPVHFFPALPESGEMHATEFYAWQAESLGVSVRRRAPRLPVWRGSNILRRHSSLLRQLKKIGQSTVHGTRREARCRWSSPPV
jgi:hypothetical protein